MKHAFLRVKSITQSFSEIARNETMTNARFLKNGKTFLKNKGFIENKEILLIDDEEIITSDMIPAKRFIEEYLSTLKPSNDFKFLNYQFPLN